MTNKSKSIQDKPEINWEEIHARLKISEENIAKAGKAKDKETLELLTKRSIDLAKRTCQKFEEKNFIDILTFKLASEVYGIESKFVRKSFLLKRFTSLPKTPNFLLGIVNFRGQIISVIDIKKLFDLPDTGISELNKVIIINNNIMEFGVLADEIIGMQKIAKEELIEKIPTLDNIRQKYLLGITPERTIVLNGEKLLNDNNIIINDKNIRLNN